MPASPSHTPHQSRTSDCSFPDFAAFAAWLDSLGLFRMRPGLERMHTALADTSLARPAPQVFHVLGSNGKGSVCAFLEGLTRAHGFTVGLYTSPHLVSVCERIRMDGRILPEAAWHSLACELEPVMRGRELSYFEVTTLLAAAACRKVHGGEGEQGRQARQGVDIAIMEAGLGGTYDAVTALERDVLCLTPISLEHTHVLGPDLASIARDKAGAVRAGQVLCCAPQEPGVEELVAEVCAEAGAAFIPSLELPELPADVRLGLAGPHQRVNARVALAAWRAFLSRRGLEPDLAAESRGLAEAFIPGRLQRVAGQSGAEFLLDGAHNPAGLAALGAALAELGIIPSALVFAAMADKDLTQMVRLASSLTPGPILLPRLEMDRAADPHALAELFGERVRVVPDVAQALDQAEALAAAAGQPALVAGSLYLLGECFKTRAW